MARKPKPTTIYRIERHNCGSQGNMTWQGFSPHPAFEDRNLYRQRIRELYPDAEVKFMIGRITWIEEM